ncbi:MAG TPA: MltR family transcriptional regulator [Bacteroidia bacterium]|nr:MltR family transcriptional regulator [Bacteroidia bacterium]
MEKDSLSYRSSFEYILEEFHKESDRAAVILVSAMIEEKLTVLIKSFLIANPAADDDLFERANAPISTFSSKIDMAFRLGLISSKYSRDLHLIRKIRNSFAHNIHSCNFENGNIKDRIKELSNRCSIMKFYEYLLEDKHPNVKSGTGGIFLFVTSIMIFQLDVFITKLKPLEISYYIEDEIMYGNGQAIIDSYKERNTKKNEVN